MRNCDHGIDLDRYCGACDTDPRNKVDFVNDRRYATDCGPECLAASCMGTLYIYLLDGDRYITAQCACCHHVEFFSLPNLPTSVKIGDIKRSHFALRAKKGN